MFREINTNTGKGSYGLQEVIDYLKNNVVQTLLITDNTNLHRVEGKCKRCQHLQEEIVERPLVIPKKTEFSSKPCPGCNSMEVEVNEQDIVDYLRNPIIKNGFSVRSCFWKCRTWKHACKLRKNWSYLRYNPGHAK